MALLERNARQRLLFHCACGLLLEGEMPSKKYFRGPRQRYSLSAPCMLQLDHRPFLQESHLVELCDRDL